MSFYYKIAEKKYPMHWALFSILFIVILAIGGFGVWSLFGGLNKFGGLWLCVGWVLVFGELKTNSTRYTMIQNDFIRHAISWPCSIAAIIYYWI